MVIGSSFMQLIVKVVLTVVLLSLGYHLLGYIVAVVISTVCAIAWMAIGLRRKLKSMPSTITTCNQDLQDAWYKYAKVIYTGSLIGLLAMHLDRFLVGSFGGVEAVGVLVVVKQLQIMPVIFLQMFLAILAPMLSDAHVRGDNTTRDHLYHLSIDWVVRLSLPLFIFLIVFGEPVLKLYGDKFASDGLYALWILLIAQLYNLVSGPIGMVMNMSGQESKMLKTIIWQTFILLILTAGLIPVYGILGASIALGLSTVFNNILCYYLANKHLKICWGNKKFLKWIAPAVLGIGAALLIKIFGSITPNAYMLFAYLFFLYIIFHGAYFAQGLHDDDKEFMSHVAKKLFKS